jgi:hypothetical protein
MCAVVLDMKIKQTQLTQMSVTDASAANIGSADSRGVTLFWDNLYACRAEQSRAEAYCRQSAGTVNPGIGPRWDPWPYIYYLSRPLQCFFFLLGALSDERTGLTVIYAAGLCQRQLSLVRAPWVSRPSFTVSHLRLPFSSPPTTRRVTVEVFDPASTRGMPVLTYLMLVMYPRHGPHRRRLFLYCVLSLPAKRLHRAVP